MFRIGGEEPQTYKRKENETVNKRFVKHKQKILTPRTAPHLESWREPLTYEKKKWNIYYRFVKHIKNKYYFTYPVTPRPKIL